MLTLNNIHFSQSIIALLLYFLILFLITCFFPSITHASEKKINPYTVVLGVAQDVGYPQAAYMKSCCAGIWDDPSKHKYAASIAIVDPETNERWIIDTTPDFKEQLYLLDGLSPEAARATISGILLTHAHIGHYKGLMHLGREVMGAKSIPVFAMHKMKDFFRGP